MADILSFALSALVGDEVAIDHIDAYQRTVGTTAWGAVVDLATIASLPADPDTAGNLLWSSALLDPAKETLLVPVAASGQARPDGFILAAQAANPSICRVTIRVADRNGAMVDGIPVTIAPAKTPIVVGGAFLSPDPVTIETGRNGAGTIIEDLSQGAAFLFTSKAFGISIRADTTGKASIDLAAIVA